MGFAARLAAKIERGPEGACWIWTGARQTTGYGNILYLGKVRLAHRLVYEILRGPIPDGLDLDHLCRVRWCVNPDHLEPVTRSVNLKRGEKMGKPWCDLYCGRGHRKFALECQVCKKMRNDINNAKRRKN